MKLLVLALVALAVAVSASHSDDAFLQPRFVETFANNVKTLKGESETALAEINTKMQRIQHKLDVDEAALRLRKAKEHAETLRDTRKMEKFINKLESSMYKKMVANRPEMPRFQRTTKKRSVVKSPVVKSKVPKAYIDLVDSLEARIVDSISASETPAAYEKFIDELEQSTQQRMMAARASAATPSSYEKFIDALESSTAQRMMAARSNAAQAKKTEKKTKKEEPEADAESEGDEEVDVEGDGEGEGEGSSINERTGKIIPLDMDGRPYPKLEGDVHTPVIVDFTPELPKPGEYRWTTTYTNVVPNPPEESEYGDEEGEEGESEETEEGAEESE